MEEQRARDAAEGHEIAINLEGKISRKVGSECMLKESDITDWCFYLPLHVEGGKADSDDSSVWSHMGRRASSDCCELYVILCKSHHS